MNIGIVGFGYWGKNLVRNFNSLDSCEVSYVCEKDTISAEKCIKLYPNINIVSDYAILLNDEFMNSLSAEDKAHFYEAALRASRTEREKSVADGEEIKNSKEKQKELGIHEVIMWSDDEVAKLRTLLLPLYKQYENFFSFDVLNQIKKLKN